MAKPEEVLSSGFAGCRLIGFSQKNRFFIRALPRKELSMSLSAALSTAELIGTDAEAVWATKLGLQRRGGFGDGGIDIEIPRELCSALHVRGLQIKSSVKGVIEFLRQALAFKRRLGRRFVWTAIGLGDPPSCLDTLVAEIEEFGGWVGTDIEDRESVLAKIKDARNLIMSL